MGKNTRKVKIFKETLTKELSCKIDVTIDEINKYNLQVSENIEKFIDCKSECLEKIDFYKKINTVNWDLLHNLYFLSFDIKDIDKELVEKSKQNRKKLTDTSNALSGIPDLSIMLNNPMFKGMIDKILPVVEKAFEGKDLSNMNINDVVSGIITKDSSKCGGVDINGLIQESMSILQDTKK